MALAAIEPAADLAREQAVASEQARALGPELVDALRATGLLRATNASPGESLAGAEAIARADAAAGWCVSIAVTSSLLLGHLPEAGVAEVLADDREIAAGVWAPRGRATIADGGLRVTGRWPFASGITHADWFFGGCVLGDELRVVALPVAELEVIDTWDTLGLRGTGSHDVAAHDLFVPARRVLSLLDGPRVEAPLYRFPLFGYFALSIAAAALGNARGAIDDLVVLAGAKVGQGASRTLAERSATQAAVAEAEAALRAARSLYYDAIDQAWTAAQDGPVGADLRLGLRLAATHATRTAAAVARSMHDLGGGSAIYATSPLQRRVRDAETATAHFQVNLATYELLGRVLLGLPANIAQL